LFGRGRVLMAQRFDTGKLRLSGESFPIADAVASSAITVSTAFSSSQNGVLVYRPEETGNLQAAWYTRSGNRLTPVGEPRPYLQFTLSPDEKRIVAQVRDTKVGTDDIWMLDLTSSILSRMSSDPATEDGPVWSPDGKEIYFSSNRKGVHNLYRK